VAPNSGHIETLLVGDIMNADVLTARETEPLDDVLQVLTEQQIGVVKIVVQEQRHERHFRI
jgi:hypothetical protein